MKHIIHRQIKRGCKYEVWASIYADFDSLIAGTLIFDVGEKEMDKAALEVFFKNMYTQLEVNEQPDILMSVSEIDQILKDKGYLLNNETFDDLKVKNG